MDETKSNGLFATFLLLLGLSIVGAYLYFYFSYKQSVYAISEEALQGPQGKKGSRGIPGVALNQGPAGPVGDQGSISILTTYEVIFGVPNNPYSLFYWNRGDNDGGQGNNINIFAAKLPSFLNQRYPMNVVYSYDTTGEELFLSTSSKYLQTGQFMIPSTKSMVVYDDNTTSHYSGFDWRIIRTGDIDTYPRDTSVDSSADLEQNQTYLLIYINAQEFQYFAESRYYLGIQLNPTNFFELLGVFYVSFLT